MNITYIIVIFLLLFIYILYRKHSIINTNLVETLSGEDYYVHNAYSNRLEAAEKIDILNDKTIKLLRYLKNNYPNDNMTINLLKRYNSDNIKENSPKDITKDTSYTINKGKILALCLRNSDGILHDINTLTFVLLHELTHIAIDINDHPPEFWLKFAEILDIAVKIGILIPIDYSINNIEYCGMTLTDNPYYSILNK